MMTRAEAIGYFGGLSDRVAGEWLCSKAEISKHDEETRSAFLALGITADEVKAAEAA